MSTYTLISTKQAAELLGYRSTNTLIRRVKATGRYQYLESLARIQVNGPGSKISFRLDQVQQLIEARTVAQKPEPINTGWHPAIAEVLAQYPARRGRRARPAAQFAA